MGEHDNSIQFFAYNLFQIIELRLINILIVDDFEILNFRCQIFLPFVVI